MLNTILAMLVGVMPLWAIAAGEAQAAADKLSELRLSASSPASQSQRIVVQLLQAPAVVEHHHGIVVFSGAPTTDKLASAQLLAQRLGRSLVRIDLSAVANKYLGETEKNLGQVIATAERSNAVLYFDEADALFGSRSDGQDSHQRYGNMDVNGLLARIDAYAGLAVLTTNNQKPVCRLRCDQVVEFIPDERSPKRPVAR